METDCGRPDLCCVLVVMDFDLTLIAITHQLSTKTCSELCFGTEQNEIVSVIEGGELLWNGRKELARPTVFKYSNNSIWSILLVSLGSCCCCILNFKKNNEKTIMCKW